MGEANYINTYFKDNPAQKEQFESDLTTLKALRYRGELGPTSQEQYNLITRSLVDRYPELMKNAAGIYRRESDDTLIEPGGPLPAQFRQYLADRQVVSQDPSFAQSTLYPLASAGTEAIASTGGAIAGGALGGLPGSVAGAAAGGALSAGVIDPALRATFGLPSKTGGEALTDIALSAGINAANELLTGGLGKLAVKAQRYLIFGGPAPARLSPQNAAELALLEEGGRLTGVDVMPSHAMMTHATRPGIEPAKNFGTWLSDTVTASFGGSTILERKVFNINQAQNALFTDAIQRLGQAGALTDSKIAAETIASLHENNYRFSRHVKRAVYRAFEQMPGVNNDLPVPTLVQRITPLLQRLDMAEVGSAVERRTGRIGNDLMDYLTRAAPVTPTTPIGTALPDFDVQGLSSLITSPLIPGSAKWAGFSPTGQGLITVATQAGGISQPLPVDPTKLIVMEPISNYAKLHELRSVLLDYGRRMEALAESAKDSHYRTQANDAGYLASLLTREIQNQATQGHIPRTTILAGQYADKVAREEAETFINRLTVGIVEGFGREPQKFAEELLKPHNAEVLKNIKKAITAQPDVILPNIGTTEGELLSELNRSSVYKPRVNQRGRTVWDTLIQPQLQAESIRGALENQSADAFTWNLEKGASMSAQAFRRQQSGRTWNPDDFVTINPSTLVRNLEQNALDPDTRRVIWGSDTNFDRWLNIAKMMERFDTKNIGARAGIGSFFTVSRQAGGLYLVGSGLTGVAQGDTSGENLFRTAAGMGLLVSPIVLTKYINDPAKYRVLMLGLRREPSNFFKSRIAVNLVNDSIKEFAQEGEKNYPVLPGESR